MGSREKTITILGVYDEGYHINKLSNKKSSPEEARVRHWFVIMLRFLVDSDCNEA
jgi:hypothetical protein